MGIVDRFGVGVWFAACGVKGIGKREGAGCTTTGGGDEGRVMDMGDGWEMVLRGLVIALVCDLWCLDDDGLGNDLGTGDYGR